MTRQRAKRLSVSRRVKLDSASNLTTEPFQRLSLRSSGQDVLIKIGLRGDQPNARLPQARADSDGFRVQHGIDKCLSSRFTRRNMFSALQKSALGKEPISFVTIVVVMIVLVLSAPSSFATTKGLSQIVTPDLQPAGDLSLSLQIQDERIANPYQLQGELGLTRWAEVAVFRGFQPDEWIFGTEIGLLTKEPFLLSVGFVNWSPHLDVDPQPFIEAGYYTEHHKIIAGATHAGYKNETILGYAYDFNKRWRLQFDWQSGSENSSTIGFTCNVTPDFQFNPALYVNNGPKHDLFGYVVFTYTFHVWSKGWPPGRIGR